MTTTDPNNPPPILPYRSPDPPASNDLALWAWGFALAPIALLLLAAGWQNSLLLGLALPCPFLAVGLGIVAFRRAVPPNVPHRRRAIAALCIGGSELLLLLMAIIILPRMGASPERANRVKCASNLRQIGQAIFLYANDNAGRFPQRLDQFLADGSLEAYVFVCPSSNDDWATGPTKAAILADFAKPDHCSYFYLGAGLTTTVSADYVLAYELPKNHDWEGFNVLYGDGHVEWTTAIWIVDELKAGHNPPPTDPPPKPQADIPR